MSDTARKQQEYRVLARKYRPQNFEELIGQDALVRTLKNAIDMNRIAHAFMLTGVRGVGKTTTARIIAKALNYIGPDGQGQPTTGDTSDCPIAQAITEDRHPDVIEMDAASNTGVDNIREILDGVRYAPTEARYKIYIIDEVHMLSKSAFNALLKTLEEPPEHVKFIFATTEIRKVPITVLSRCQRFDLRRVEVEELSAHFQNICGKENVSLDDEAAALLARAADGSVRDGLSLLDRAMALTDGDIKPGSVQEMLGLADRAKILDILEAALKGNITEALDGAEMLHKNGMDGLVLIQDLLDLTHKLTKARAAPVAANDKNDQIKKLAEEISMPSLGRAWQILLKGLNEVQLAPNPQDAAEMVLIRLVYAADLPDPAKLIKTLKDAPVNAGAPAQTTSAAPMPQMAPAAPPSAGSVQPQAIIPAQTQLEGQPVLQTLGDVVTLLEDKGEMILAGNLYNYAHLVKMKEGLIEIKPAEDAPQSMTQQLKKALDTITGQNWMISISHAPGAPTLAQQQLSAQEEEMAAIKAQPLVKNVLELFPGAQIKAITPITD